MAERTQAFASNIKIIINMELGRGGLRLSSHKFNEKFTVKIR